MTRSGSGGGAKRLAAGARALWVAIVLLLKVGAGLLALATPLLGVWVASSLAAYGNGPVWLTALAGLLLFPIVPVGWDLLASWRRRRKSPDRPRVLTLGDRLILRTLSLNAVFLAALLSFWPELGFTALQTRGDWPLEGVSAGWADGLRRGAFAVADRLEWVYLAAHENPYAELGQGGGEPVPEPSPDEIPAPEHDTGGARQGGTAGQGSDEPRWQDTRWGGERHGRRPDDASAPDAGPSRARDGGAGAEPRDEDAPPPRRQNAAPRWPAPAQLHPVAAAMPRSAEASIESVARHIGERVSSDRERLRALHDWVADNVAYDVPSLRSGKIPRQDAETTFESRSSVCAGYANLMVALGKVLGLEIAYVPGNSRDRNGNVGGLGHAWNAVKLDGAWHLVDATWDAGYVEGDTFVKRFSTDYYLTPPAIFGLDHFPDRPAWQLRRPPLSRGDFMRQPMVTPAFHAKGLEILEPRRSQVTVDDSVTVRLANPRGLHLLATAYRTDADGGEGRRCDVSAAQQRVTVKCSFAAPGAYRVKLFAAKQRYGSFPYVGQLLVNSSQ